MLQDSPAAHAEPSATSTAHVVHALMHFLLAVRYRKSVVLTVLAIALVMGGLYYATATRYYESKAQVLVMYAGADMTGSFTSEGPRNVNLMLTFEKLFTTAAVVEGALKHLRPEDRIDMAAAPQEAWPAMLQAGLSAQVITGTDIIEVSYRSKDPKAAVRVVAAVVQSYAEFLDETHKGYAGEVIRLITQEKVELEQRLEGKQRERLEASYRLRDMGIRSDGNTLHPAVQKAVSFKEKLIEVQLQRVGLENSLVAIQRSIRNREDLRQHIMTVADAVGNQIMMTRLGLTPSDAYTQAEMQRSMLADRAELKEKIKHLGPNHPDVTELQTRIQTTQQFLRDRQRQINGWLDELQDRELGPMLDQMVRQKLGETWELEQKLQVEVTQAENEAVAMNGQLAYLEDLERDLEWLRQMREVLLERVAKIELKQGGQEVSTAVVQEPVEAARPVFPNLKRTILMALMGGLALGLALVYVFDTLDDRFRSAEEMQAQLDVPVLAMVRQLTTDETAGPGVLQVHVAPNATESEAFRTLRTALALADKEARQIVISSAEPGDGKTTVLANLAATYAQSEKRTLLIDADLRRPGLTALMGMRGVEGLSSVIRGEDDVVRMATEYVRPSGIERLDVLPSGPRPTNPAEMLAHRRFSELLAWAETVYDQVLIDSPPALATSDAAVIGRLADGLILVVQPDKNRRRLVIRAADSLTALKIPLLGVVINRVGSDGDGGYYGYHDGYGYAYDYAPDDATEENDEQRPGAADTYDPVGDAAVSCQHAADHATYHLPDPSTPISPRRVA